VLVEAGRRDLINYYYTAMSNTIIVASGRGARAGLAALTLTHTDLVRLRSRKAIPRRLRLPHAAYAGNGSPGAFRV